MDPAILLANLFVHLTSWNGIASIIAVACLPRWLAKGIAVVGCSVLAGGLTYLDSREYAAVFGDDQSSLLGYILYYFVGLFPIALISGWVMSLFDRKQPN